MNETLKYTQSEWDKKEKAIIEEFEELNFKDARTEGFIAGTAIGMVFVLLGYLFFWIIMDII
ncbi:hypothetical protein [Eremococcus coleocola]|uniref:hypothetical protein n=1 Tax=Eremococcus coleocola TaxID=88132 RepID=UPI00058EC9B0|nr:hypothetical protein [Eremococcus coleocola]